MKLLSIALLGALSAPLFLPATRSTAAAPADPVNYEVDPVHSSVVFKIKHMNVSWFYGRFNDIQGSVVYDEKKPEASSVSVEIATESVDSKAENRDKHLQSPDFLSVKEFPKMTFKSKSVKKGDKGKLSVTGDLTLHGVTKPLTCEVELVGAAKTQMGERAGFETTFTIKREDFGMKNMLEGIGNDVQITVSLECAKPDAEKKQ